MNGRYSCSKKEGEDEKLLSDIQVPIECEYQCLQEANGDGCCSILTGNGCYWKSGSFAIHSGGNSLAVNCTVDGIS